MTPPIPYNIPEGKSEQEALPDELLQLLDNVFQGVTSAFGDNATLYRIDVGKIYESVQDGELVFAGQFVDKSDGEIFNFEINQETNQLGYKSSGEILDRQSLADFCGSSSNEEDQDSNEDQSDEEGLRPYNLLLDAINDESSEAGQSPFGSKLRKDLDYLAALSAAMYHGGITIEAQPLYTGLHSYTIKYALSGLQLFTQSIGSMEGLESELMAEQWVDEHGMDFASAVVKEFSSRRSEQMRELIQAGDQAALEETKALVEEAIAMAMACTVDLIKTVAEADDYKHGDVQAAFAAAIDVYCPIDNSEGYHVSENPRQMASEWQQVTDHSGCSEDLSMAALGLPVAEHMSANSEQDSAEKVDDSPTTDADNAEIEDEERIYYVNVGEGPSRNWDDCRQFGFLAAGGGRKWSKQLEKIKIGDTVIAYLKGYGYVGIGKVTSTATPATKFLANGVLIKELPLINDTIRSIKRFSKENGEYLIGVAWQVAVTRENAAWKANAGLYTTALVCASLRNQTDTVSFVSEYLVPVQATMSLARKSQDQVSESSWKSFSTSLISFLQSNTDEIGNEELLAKAGNLHALCPGDLLAIEQAASVRSLMNDDLNNKLAKVCMRLIKAQDEILTLFFIGICELGDMTDEILEQFLDLIDEGMNLSTLATEYVPHNAFEVNALMSLIYWPEMPDWARAHLATRNEVGLTNQDRDNFLEYLGSRDILGAETLLSICSDIAVAPYKYSSAFAKAFKAFFASDFEAICIYNSDSYALANHLDELGDHCIAECRKSLDLVETFELEGLEKPIALGSSPRLVGDELITKIKELDGSEKEDLIRKTGYSLLLPDGSERLLIEEFYNALLEAKGYSNEEESEERVYSFPEVLTCVNALTLLEVDSLDTEDALEKADFEGLLDKVINHNWMSEEEYALFFVKASMSMYHGLVNGEVSIFGHEVSYSFYPGTTVWDLWTKARHSYEIVEKVADVTGCITEAMRESLNITSIFNIFPAALNASYSEQSLGEWLAHGLDSLSHEDNEFLCTFLALAIDNDAALIDVASNLRSAPVLEELIFCNPELILSEELLLVGYGSQGLLHNGCLSANSLVYLSALLLDVSLPANFTGKTDGDNAFVSVGQSGVTCFRDDNNETIIELNLESIAEAIGSHPNCSAELAEKLNELRF